MKVQNNGQGRVSARMPLMVGLSLLILLAVLEILNGGTLVGWNDLLAFPTRPNTLAQAIIETVRLPRIAAAVLVGAGLAVAGAIMQTALRNPLAAPDILAVTSGAQLALVVATLLLPFAIPSLAATAIGGLAGSALCLAIGGGLRAPPIRLALSGVAVALALGALSSSIVVLADERASGLILWSSGMLEQTGWTRVISAGPVVVAVILLLMSMTRQLDLLSLGDAAAKGLGATQITTVIVLLASVLLSAAAVSLAGPIGFVGLAVPNLLRALGIVAHRKILLLSSVWGPVTLLAADLGAQMLSNNGTAVPTGAVVAGIGAPVMLLILRRMKLQRETRPSPLPSSSRLSPLVLALLLPALLILAVAAGFTFGDGIPSTAAEFRRVLDLRLPRVLVSLGAGALLAVAGVYLQAATRNPLSGPETLGLAQGAALFSLLALLCGLQPGSWAFQSIAMAGTFSVLLVLFLFGEQRSPERFVLTGLAIAASLGAASTIVIVKARLQVAEALSWLAGSTHGRGFEDAAGLIPWLSFLAASGMILSSRLDILALDRETARSLGLPTERTRLIAAGCAGVLVAGAVSVVGAIGFVGLLAPHAGRLLVGPRHARLIPVAAILGATLVVLADMAGRTLMPPAEIPAGLGSALIGAPLFAMLLRHKLK